MSSIDYFSEDWFINAETGNEISYILFPHLVEVSNLLSIKTYCKKTKTYHMKSKFILLILLITSYLSQGQMRYFYANLEGAQQVPPNASTGSGVAVITYNTATKNILVYADYQGLSAPVTASHIHSAALAGSNAGVLFNLTNTGGTTGTLSGNAILTPTDETNLFDGKMYVNVHNANFPGGEIRGQVTAVGTTNSYFFNGRLQGSQQVPPNPSTATGNFSAILDATANMVYLTGSFAGLAANATVAHIHTGAAHGNGSPFVNLTPSAATTGTVHGISSITATNTTDMLNGNTYVNVHNATYPGGEIRGQATMLSQYSFFKTSLSGANEVPPNASTAKGTVIVKFNNSSKVLELVGDYQNLATAATASHIHAPAMAGVNAAVFFGLANTGGTSGTLSGTTTLDATREAQLFNGEMYVNVHNANFPGGEIRGQLSGTSAGETQFLTGVLQGAQENPVNASTGSGSVTVLLDRLTREVYVTGSFTGLAKNASAAHLHRGVTGAIGPVIVPLSPTTATAGTITGNAVVSATFADSLINGLVYANVHNSDFPGGELRAQLGNQVLPVKLSYFNGYRDRSNINLVWQSAQEIDLKQYEVEQQHPSTKLWINKGVVRAIGGAIQENYRMTDVPLTGADNYVFYRLKVVDKNGGVSYSPTVRINYKQSTAALNILSNPVTKGMLRYNITGLSTDKRAEVSIIDLNGKLMYKTVQPGFSTNDINVSALAAGMYKLVIKIDNLQLQQSFLK